MPDLEKWVLHRLYEVDQKVHEASHTYDFQTLYTEIHNFCAVDLSAFYFDIRKDSLYCDHPTDPKRRATRTVMDVTFECLTKWLAPVLCFTAEEAWLSRYPQEKSSIHLEMFPSLPFAWDNPDLSKKYEALRTLRKVITGALEVARASKHIGSSLQASVTVFLTPALNTVLEGVSLAELSITSEAKVKIGSVPQEAFTLEEVPDVGVVVDLAEGEKCARCWKVLPEVKGHDLCHRCTDVVKKIGSIT